MSARRMFNAPEMSRTALVERSVGVASGAARRAFLSFLSMVLLQVLRWQGTRPILSGVQARMKASRSALTLVCVVHVPRTHADFACCTLSRSWKPAWRRLPSARARHPRRAETGRALSVSDNAALMQQ